MDQPETVTAVKTQYLKYTFILVFVLAVAGLFIPDSRDYIIGMVKVLLGGTLITN